MTTYKEIRGTNIEAVASDPSNPVEGQVWYNTTSNVVKGFGKSATAAWSTSGNLNTARKYPVGAGTQTAGLAYSGNTPGGAPGATETYNGSNWTSVNSMNTGRFQAGGATSAPQTAALVFGGQDPIKADTET